MIWTDEIVRHRFIEAADTLLHLQVGGLKPNSVGNAWSMAVDGWDAYGDTGNKARHRPDPATISRYEEVQSWMGGLIPLDTDRTMIWARAMCEAGRHSFAGWCEENAVVRQTAYRRTNQVYQTIALTLCKRGVSLRLADDARLLQIGALRDIETPKVENVASPSHYRADDVRPDPNLPDDPEAFKRWLDKTNAARRKEQERRRRAKLGAEEAA